ncbi:MAG: four-carbon acid sugar kinase family protein [Cypionkella sp.]|uniref:four-carbon acid sugar kinase family protein n=1 Tax=Cypionkella sp. TaxID=2811411 RepID=UPI002ABC79B0|nr:four-carbon acid sugar kinase family protein [Cypionkella sp.]MDZ4311607.1 four-carbon acid sugar kinase family protein [Cypionkella sp.]
MQEALPNGLLMTWYGDDFTGSAAVMEALTFAGLPSVLFFDTPTPAQLARFPGMRGLGIASTARSHSPAWMAANMPAPLAFLAALNAPFLHYKICSTLDSAAHAGNIGTAIDLALQACPSKGIPVLTAAPRMRRYQAFGHLFAGSPQGVFRLDRHPVMAQHPVTPMAESDVLRHLATQTPLPSALLDLEALADPQTAQTALDSALQTARLLSIDTMTAETDAAAGRLIWQNRDNLRLLIGSQGIEYALIEHWQREGLVPAASPTPSAGEVAQIIAVSGSVSPTTAAQIEWSAANGFGLVRLNAATLLSNPKAAEAEAAQAALALIAQGQSPLILTAAGPTDPAVTAFRTTLAQSEIPPEAANQRIGESLGRVLDATLRASKIRRAVISGGDTSGHGVRQLGLFALSALAPTIPGAALFMAHGDGVHDGLQLALKGGQMGSADYFGWIRAGGGAR